MSRNDMFNQTSMNPLHSAPLFFRIMFAVVGLFILSVFVLIILTFTGVIHPMSGFSYTYNQSYGTNGYSSTYQVTSDK